MRSSALARVVIAALGGSVLITPGCGDPPTEPSPSALFSVLSISPTEGPTVLATAVRIAGTGFQSGDTVTVDGNRVEATVLGATTISLAMPAHAAGKVDVTVSRALPIGTRSLSVPGGYRYSVIPPPVVSELVPNTGSTAGGAPVFIRGTGLGNATTLTVDGILTPFEPDFFDEGILLHSTMPAHAAGTVEVIVTDRYGRAGRGVFTYAPPATFDFNGDWEGWARLHVEVSSDSGARFVLTFRDNMASVSCSVCRPGENCFNVSTPSLTLDPQPVVTNGEFSLAGDGISLTGKVLSPIYATGSISTAACGSRYWWASKK
jgi:hypothetical protein